MKKILFLFFTLLMTVSCTSKTISLTHDGAKNIFSEKYKKLKNGGFVLPSIVNYFRSTASSSSKYEQSYFDSNKYQIYVKKNETDFICESWAFYNGQRLYKAVRTDYVDKTTRYYWEYENNIENREMINKELNIVLPYILITNYYTDVTNAFNYYDIYSSDKIENHSITNDDLTLKFGRKVKDVAKYNYNYFFESYLLNKCILNNGNNEIITSYTYDNSAYVECPPLDDEWKKKN